MTGSVLIGLAVIMVTAFVFGKLAERLRQPAVMGEITAGIVLGPSLLGLFPGRLNEQLFPVDARSHLQVLGELGLVLFMFGVGYRLDLAHVRGARRQVISVSLSSAALPFALGTGLAAAFHPWSDPSELKIDGVLGPALFLGIAMSITAFPVLARIIHERGMSRDPIGAISLACAAVQDVLAWCLLAGVTVFVSASGPWSLVRMVIGSVALVFGLMFVVRPALVWLLAPERRWLRGTPAVLAMLLPGTLLCAWMTQAIGVHAVFGAFAFGASVPRGPLEERAPDASLRIEQVSLLLLPVFFTVTGMSVYVSALGAHGLVMIVCVLAAACAGKFIGAAGAARLSGVTRRQSLVLGVLLNARGLTELVILKVGLDLGLIDTRMFTVMVVMALVTTFMTGPLLERLSPRGQPSTVVQHAEPERARSSSTDVSH
jgi:Kef-type K+ transport system membrane component KefB